MPDDNNSAESRMIQCAESVKDLLDEYRGGEANKRPVEEAKVLLAQIETLTTHGYLHERTQSLANWFEILYSARKHLNYGGDKRVRMHILDDVSKIQTFVKSGRARGAS